MPTANSSTDQARGVWLDPPARQGLVAEQRRAYRDVIHLVRFRASSLRPRARRIAVAVFVSITLLVWIIPAVVPRAGAAESDAAFQVLLVLPTAYAAFFLLNLASAIASGGGRELVSSEQGVAFPISPTTDHLGALLLAPLNIAWLIEGWALIGATSFAVGFDYFWGAVPLTVLWILMTTAAAQAVAWTVEGVRRQPGGLWIVRGMGIVLALAAGILQLNGLIGPLLDQMPTDDLIVRMALGIDLAWLAYLVGLAALFAGFVVVGAIPATWAARRLPRDETRVESGSFTPRATPGSDFAMLLRIDRGSVWRAVPMRRGVAVLAVLPGMIALAGNLPWSQLTILPGLVASGAVLLFGVNAWSLDGRGILWKESLPVSPAVVWAARSWVMVEFIVVASAVTLLLACLRAGVPTASEVSALVCIWLIVVLQVLGASLKWSLRSPYSVDLRSARATPAPPLVMVGYSTKLAMLTTFSSLLFSASAESAYWQASVLVALPFVVYQAFRFLGYRDGWVNPVKRARVATTVAL
ncbi:MAG: hypothetical protein ACSLEW_00250 [Nocardioides sp.]